MIRALVWKEVREQGVIAIALAVLGVGLLVGVGVLNSANGGGNSELRSPLTDPGVLATLALTVTAGCVVGGTLFAAEKEMGTATFLGLLPVRRRTIWLGKMLAGAGIVFVVVATMLIGAAAAGSLGPTKSLLGWVVLLLVGGLAAFAWASVGSVVTRSSLTAAALGAGLYGTATGLVVPLAIVAWLAISSFLPAGFRSSVEGVASLASLLLLAVPVALSLWLYTAPDRDRLRAAVVGRSSKPRPARSMLRLFPAFRAAIWMNIRQQRWMAVLLASGGLLSGLSLLAPASPFVAVWPSVAFFLAVLVGVIGWYDEQTNSTKKFWLERSLPTGHLWGAKLLVGLMATALMTLVALLPVIVKMIATRSNPDAAPSFVMLRTYDFPVVEFVLLWPIYGFASGHLCGLLFKKAVVAVAVAVMGGAVLAAVWLPSLLGGGLHLWQVALPPLAMLAGARLLLWVGVADRLTSRRGLLRMGLAGVLVLGATAAGLSYRVLEIPNDPAREADVAFEQSEIPKFEADTARLKYRATGVQLRAALGLSVPQRQQMGTPAIWQAEQTPLSRLSARQRQVLEAAIEHGWQPSEDANALLTAFFRNGWADTFAEASALPPGTLEDPRELQLNSSLEHLTALYAADTLLLVRGLRAQHDGDPERFVADFAQVLRLSRTVRYKSISACADAGRRIEWRALQALPRWLENLNGREDLLAKVAAELADHDRLAGDDRADVKLADQVVLRNTLNAASKVLRTDWDFSRAADPDTRGKMDAEADLVNVCWQMPWEKERQRRLVGVGNGAGYPTILDDRTPFRGLPGVGWWPNRMAMRRDAPRGEFSEVEKTTRAERNAVRILVALRRYELKHGDPPGSLQSLAPEFLPTVPNDPFGGGSFGYRLARAGETITLENRTNLPRAGVLTEVQEALAAAGGGLALVEGMSGASSPDPTNTTNTFSELLSVPAGRPILWGTGRDGIDDGGIGTTSDPWAGRHTDRVYWLAK